MAVLSGLSLLTVALFLFQRRDNTQTKTLARADELDHGDLFRYRKDDTVVYCIIDSMPPIAEWDFKTFRTIRQKGHVCALTMGGEHNLIPVSTERRNPVILVSPDELSGEESRVHQQILNN